MSEKRMYKMRHPGSLRCCLTALDDEMLRRSHVYPEGRPLATEGETFDPPCCPETGRMVVRDGAWQWVGISTD